MKGLEGIKVIDLTQGVSGPFCTRLLSQMGARCIKVERPGVGDLIRHWDDIVQGMCSGHVWVNYNKESISLNLKTEKGREILFKLLEDADVLVENFVPGTLEGWGITYEKLKSHNPKLIFCQISGFGQEGPFRDRTALDLIMQGESGLIFTNGSPEEPAKLSLSICDISASMYATTGILEALYYREKTGLGQKIEISLLESILTWTGYFPYMVWYENRLPKRVGLHHHTMCPYGPYMASDNQYVIVAGGAGSWDQWSRFCECVEATFLMEDERFMTNELRLQNQSELDELLTHAFKKKTRDEWLERFNQFGIPAGAMRDLKDALQHPQVVYNNFIKEVESANGKVKVFDFPVKANEMESSLEYGPPLLGEHTEKILKEIGYDDHSIIDLERNKVI